jgi:hypothetical protein
MIDLSPSNSHSSRCDARSRLTELPDPLPEGAFGHIRSEDWLEATSVQVGSEEGQGSVFLVTADMSDVPLALGVLPSRQKEFSNSVSKVCEICLFCVAFDHAEFIPGYIRCSWCIGWLAGNH